MAANAPYFEDHIPPGNVALIPENSRQFPSRSASTKDDDIYRSDQVPGTPDGALQETHTFVELLEAATTAAEKAHTLVGPDTAREVETLKAKRKRTSLSPDILGDGAPPGFKRARVHATTSTQSAPHMARASVLELDPNLETQAGNAAPCGMDTPGIHSAAALFRQPPGKSTRKYTRLPMSKLFMSLQLSPESFLHLQAEAKSYMLNSAHAERQHCVGNRGKGDTDMVKLRLFNCVREFLDSGAGERFFGENATSRRQREKDPREAARALGEDEFHAGNDLTWPRDGNKLIGLVTPLLRRMVTNERQRVYAIETRKGASKGKEGSAEAAEKAMPATPQQIPAITRLPPSQSHDVPGAPLPSIHHSYHIAANQQPPESIKASLPLSLPFSWVISDISSSDNKDLTEIHGQTPQIKHINLFLKKNKCIIGKLRFRNTEEAPLFQLSWSDLFKCFNYLMEKCNHRTQGPLRRGSLDMGHDTLRGLAAAATNIPLDNPHSKSTSPIDTESRLFNVAADTLAGSVIDRDGSQYDSATLMTEITARNDGPEPGIDANLHTTEHKTMSQYCVEAMRSTAGRAVIKNDSEWESLKLDVAFADWADQTLNAVATLQ